MKFGSLALGLAIGGCLALSALAAVSADVAHAAGASSTAPGSATSDAAVLKGKQVFQEVCGACHDLAVSTSQTKSREDWQATVSRMANDGAALNDEQIAQVVAYLAKTYGTQPDAGSSASGA